MARLIPARSRVRTMSRTRTAIPAALMLLVVLTALLPAPALAQAGSTATALIDSTSTAGSFNWIPSVNIGGTQNYELPIQLLILLTVLSLAPAIIILMTSFTRLVVVFSILRTALGTQQSPPTQVIIGLSLFLTLFIMHPVLNRIQTDALEPYMEGKITQQMAMDRAATPIKGFMLAHTREKDLMLFMDMAGVASYNSPDDVSLNIAVPAFVISELRVAFQIGFMIFLPFLVVDLIVASVLMSMGMMMLPPMMISLPLKLLLFVLTDGWYLIVQSLVHGYAS
ncbi:MAG TPA: flagellar type III secretion system pore protein FliP [Rhodothermales bacterium]|nr:flagellar type III secretion system pore protein FliP [Rhodothermales bacterium]